MSLSVQDFFNEAAQRQREAGFDPAWEMDEIRAAFYPHRRARHRAKRKLLDINDWQNRLRTLYARHVADGRPG